MTAAHDRLSMLRREARVRSVAIVLSAGLPPAAALVALAWRASNGPGAAVTAIAALALLAWAARRAAARIDPRWVGRRLDAALPELEDSSGLLLHTGPLSGLQALQRARVARRLERGPVPDLRPAWPWRGFAVAWLAALVLLAIALAWPATPAGGGRASDGSAAASGDAGTRTRVVAATLEVSPPSYTGLPARSERGLETRAPVDARLAWRLRFEPQPGSAHLAVHDGRRIALRRDGGQWRAEDVLDASLLYRIEVEGAPPADPALHRIDAIPDQPPQVRVIEPEQNVVVADPDQTRWPLRFEAGDDYGLGAARLVLTLAQGSGEAVAFSEIVREIEGEGDALRRRYDIDLDLAELGVGPGDDVVARLEVEDNRAPTPQQARSASVVLRWPSPAAGAVSDFEGLVQRTLPAYFRSQRQIIIDTEALIAERDALPEEAFVTRSDAIGVDQRLLRLRYGQFMGEEAEGGVGAHDHDHDHDHDDHDGHAHAEEAHAGHEHDGQHDAPGGAAATGAPASLFADSALHEDVDDADETPPQPAPGAAAGFGESGDVLQQFGHVHDQPEAATMLDPATRALLREALSAMWQSEGHLRQGRPEAALPYEHVALDYIQQVQQSNRIYLARVGLELPPIDPTRRLSGDLDGVTDREPVLEPAEAGAGPLLALWRALDDGGDAPDAADFEAASRWVLEHETRLDDPLGVIAALDAVRRDPDCRACRERLRTALWPALPLPAAGVVPRAAADARGAAYLDALQAEPPR